VQQILIGAILGLVVEVHDGEHHHTASDRVSHPTNRRTPNAFAAMIDPAMSGALAPPAAALPNPGHNRGAPIGRIAGAVFRPYGHQRTL
jgi:hypothetical protein